MATLCFSFSSDLQAVKTRATEDASNIRLSMSTKVSAIETLSLGLEQCATKAIQAERAVATYHKRVLSRKMKAAVDRERLSHNAVCSGTRLYIPQEFLRNSVNSFLFDL